MSQQGSSASASDSLTIKASDGSGEFTAYLAQPASGAGPGLVIAQEIFGVNNHIRNICERFALRVRLMYGCPASTAVRASAVQP